MANGHARRRYPVALASFAALTTIAACAPSPAATVDVAGDAPVSAATNTALVAPTGIPVQVIGDYVPAVQPTVDATVMPTTAALSTKEGPRQAGSFKITTCEMLGADGGIQFATSLYVGAAIKLLKSEPIAGTVTPLSAGERQIVLESLHGLKDANGKFCGVVDDPGGWE